jgi:hypothetical protein
VHRDRYLEEWTHAGKSEAISRRAKMMRADGLVGLGRGGAVRRSEISFIPIASCLQGTILAPTPARPPTAGSVAHGH